MTAVVRENIVQRAGFVLLLCLIVFWANDFFKPVDDRIAFDDPFIAHKYAFAYEIAGNEWDNPDQALDRWFFEQPAPFKYRLLAKLPLLAPYTLLRNADVPALDAMYWTYLAWTLIYLAAALWLGGLYIAAFMVRAEPALAPRQVQLFYLGAGVMTALAPVLFAFKYPVHGGISDLLGYALLAGSMLALLHRRLAAFTVLTLGGLFCRETNLLVLLPFMLMCDWRLSRRLAVAAGLMAVFVLYRLLWDGSYNPLGAAAHNLQHPAESFAFLFLTFAPFWLLATLEFLRWLRRGMAHEGSGQEDSLVRAVYRAFLPATAAVLALVFAFARVREIRIEFILYVLYLPLGLLFVCQLLPLWSRVLRSWLALPILFTAAVLVFRVLVWLTPRDAAHRHALRAMLRHFYDGFGGGWTDIFLGYLFVTLVVCGLLLASAVTLLRRRGERGSGPRSSRVSRLAVLDRSVQPIVNIKNKREVASEMSALDTNPPPTPPNVVECRPVR